LAHQNHQGVRDDQTSAKYAARNYSADEKMRIVIVLNVAVICGDQPGWFFAISSFHERPVWQKSLKRQVSISAIA